MKPIKGWDEAPAFTGEFRALPKDKYVCKIMEVVEETVNGGNRRIVIYYDIAEGPYKDYFSGLYKEAKKKDASIGMDKWQGRYFQSNIETTGLPWFKGIITSLERSNPGFKWNWDEKKLKGKVFGGLFRYEEYWGNDGKKHRSTKLTQIRNLDGLKDAELPEDSLIPENELPPSQKGTAPAQQQLPFMGRPDADGFLNVPEGLDEELPFN